MKTSSSDGALGAGRFTQMTTDGDGSRQSRRSSRFGPVKTEKATHRYARVIVDNGVFVGSTTVLTLFALTGDDMRMMFTTIGFDFWWNFLVVFCFFVFASECALSCLGKDDYFLGFFFYLDVVSTCTLILDLTPVSSAMVEDPDDFGAESSEDASGADNFKASKSAKIGAKAGRVIRVLRLVRILKLYKAYYDAKARKRAAELRKEQGDADEDDWDEEEDMEDEAEAQGGKAQTESRVGKKLSEMTTRRLICLILSMLLVLPMMQEDWEAYTSADYGADAVLEQFNEWKSGATTKDEYMQAILQYVYYHNWFAGSMGFCQKMGERESCPDKFYGHLFWIGIMGDDLQAVQKQAEMAQLGSTIVQNFNARAAEQRDIFNFGVMPPEAQEILASPWTLPCDYGQNMKRRGISLLEEEIPDVIGRTVTCPEDLRLQERTKANPRLVTISEHRTWHFTFYFDLRPYTRQSAIWNLFITLFILILLVLGSMMFSNDANRLVVNPVEKMIRRVEAIRDNPLIAMKMADEEFKQEEIAKSRKRKQGKDCLRMWVKDIITCEVCTKSNNEPMETVILEKTIIKLGSLLALGFGEAGANIIALNMSGSDSAGVNAMIPGKRVDCIVGIARVKDFSTATEVLQAKIMTYVNQIAEIVHGVVNDFHGAPNKNSGDTFLVIWQLMEQGTVGRLAEMSVVAFAKILGAVHRSQTLGTYRGHPGLQMRLKNFRVNLTFGLHLGWAIEGAVGSEFKIDASYLSPNVSIATSMERLAYVYGVSLVVAQSVVERCSVSLVREMRLIDCVKIRGSKTPMDLYTMDLDWESVEISTYPPLPITWNSRNRFKARQRLEEERKRLWSDGFDVAVLFREDEALRRMRKRYSVEFFQLFNMGYQNYSQGEWQVAKKFLSCCDELLGHNGDRSPDRLSVVRASASEDGPSKALLKFMDQYKYEAPKTWKGVRDVET